MKEDIQNVNTYNGQNIVDTHKLLELLHSHFYLKQNMLFNIKIPLLCGKEAFLAEKNYVFGKFKFKFFSADEENFIDINILFPENIKTSLDFTLFVKRIVEEIKIHLQILSFSLKLKIEVENKIFINNVLFDLIQRNNIYSNSVNTMSIHNPKTDFRSIYRLDKKYQVQVMNSIEQYMQGLNYLQQEDLDNAAFRFWCAMEHLACDKDVKFTGDQRYIKGEKIGEVSDIGKHVTNFILFYSKNNIDDKIKWEKALNTLYKAYRCDNVHSFKGISQAAETADFNGYDYIEGETHFNIDEKNVIIPGLKWVERTVYQVINNFISQNSSNNVDDNTKLEDNFVSNVSIQKRTQKFINMTDRDIKEWEYVTYDMFTGGNLDKSLSNQENAQKYKSEKSATNRIGEELFKGIFAKPNKHHDELKNRLKQAYNLSDSSLPALEKGLRNATFNNRVEDISDFMKLGVNINAANLLGKTALHYAIEENHVIVAKKLLEYGALHNISDSTQKTAFDYAKESENIDILNLFPTHTFE